MLVPNNENCIVGTDLPESFSAVLLCRIDVDIVHRIGHRTLTSVHNVSVALDFKIRHHRSNFEPSLAILVEYTIVHRIVVVICNLYTIVLIVP